MLSDESIVIAEQVAIGAPRDAERDAPPTAGESHRSVKSAFRVLPNLLLIAFLERLLGLDNFSVA